MLRQRGGRALWPHQAIGAASQVIFIVIMHFMWQLYLDESGDLGFDFVNAKPSKFFTVCVIAIQGHENNRGIAKAVQRTIQNKLNPRNKKKGILELKGTNTTLDIKKYFYNKCSFLNFHIYALTINKRKVYEHLATAKDRFYNYVTRKVIDEIPVDQAKCSVTLVLDKSKGKVGVKEFNDYMFNHLKGRIDPKIPLYINHYNSHENNLLQAADLFSWGIWRSYEKKDLQWLEVFQGRVKYNVAYFK
jgi:Protein of unknown function (DUF3800)